MPRRATYALHWQPERGAYALLRDGATILPPVTPDTPAWSAWLTSSASFAFMSASGATCTVRKEARQRGGEYWCAYRRSGGRMLKRYLGRAGDLTLARLEDAASALDTIVPAPRAPSAPFTPPADALPRGAIGPLPPAIAHPPAPLLATKLHMPRAAAPVIDRPHLRQRLQRGLERPLTILTAPAGFGKTTALRAWLQHDRVRAGWLSLDRGDNDPAQFWAYTLAALDSAHPGVAAAAQAMLRAPTSPPLAAVVRALLNAITALPRDITLVLDDYHLITEPAIHASLALLFEHSPAQLHLYLAGREEPPLPLARLRVEGHVGEVGADHLRFRPDEVAAFLEEVMELRLPVEEVLTLAERTDGWVAGLQVAGLSLREHPDPARFIASFSGSHRHVIAYIAEEVLATQSEEVQTFLLQTSILTRLCGPLCDAVTGRADGQAMLERLARANLFIVPLDEEYRWFRYYHLFADLLRHRLRQSAHEHLPELRQRAARWLAAEGFIAEAVDHLLAAGAASEAAIVVERAVPPMVMRGELAPALSLIALLPEAAVVERPGLCLAHAQALFTRGQLDVVERRLTQAERGLSLLAAEDAEERRAIAAGIAGGWAVLDAMRGDADATERHARAALTMSGGEDDLSRAGPILALGHAHRMRGDLRAAEAAYDEASRLSFTAGNLFLGTLALTQRAYTLVLAGRLREAADLYRQVIGLAEARGGPASALAATASSGLGDVLYQWGDLPAARAALERAATLSEEWETPEDQAAALALLAHVLQSLGHPDQARETMRRAETLVARGTHFPWLAPHVASLTTRLALRQGRLADAERWAAERDLMVARYASHPAHQSRDGEYLTYARVLLARADATAAEAILDAVARAAQADGHLGVLIETLALRALAEQARGDTEAALTTLTRATTLAAPEDYVRLFIDEGPAMRSLLARLREREPKDSDLRRFLDALLWSESAAPNQRPAPGPRTIEPLSAREREVLRLLAQGHANAEIARQLIIATSTVKTHVHHLFAKLQASDRLSAVTRARALGLLAD